LTVTARDPHDFLSTEADEKTGNGQAWLVEQRYRAVLEVLDGSPVSEVAVRYGVSRRSVYSWKARHSAAGIDGLREAPRRPRTSPSRLAAGTEALVCELRRAHPRWGARRIAFEMAGDGERRELPSFRRGPVRRLRTRRTNHPPLRHCRSRPQFTTLPCPWRPRLLDSDSPGGSLQSVFESESPANITSHLRRRRALAVGARVSSSLVAVLAHKALVPLVHPVRQA
jgi:Helix-turn-helix domain